jgi:organic hydroperoxide reductase OsmC/OhrA
MLGTLAASLAARKIELPDHALSATVEGVNELVDNIVTLKRINVHYSLSIPAGSRETVDRALSRHMDKCPTAQSLKGAIEVAWTAQISEEGPVGAVGA